MNGPHTPAVMFENSMERRLAIDVAEKANRGRVKIAGHMHLSFFGRVDDRFDTEVIMQRLAAASVDIADRGADLGVAVAVDVFLEKVDKTSVPLQDRENPQVGPGRHA